MEGIDHIPLNNLTNLCREMIRSQKILRSWEYISGIFQWRSTYLTGESRRDPYLQTLLGGCFLGINHESLVIFFNVWQITLLPFRIMQLLGLDQVWLMKVVLVICACSARFLAVASDSAV